jgi:hypothetical protein
MYKSEQTPLASHCRVGGMLSEVEEQAAVCRRRAAKCREKADEKASLGSERETLLAIEQDWLLLAGSYEAEIIKAER